MYDNSFAQGATQSNYTNYLSKNSFQQNSKYAVGAAINAIGFANNIKGFGFSDITNGATGWDGVDLVKKYTGGNAHRKYVWSADSKPILEDYMKLYGDGTVDVDNFQYSDKKFDIKATSIKGQTLLQKIQGLRGEGKQGRGIKFK